MREALLDLGPWFWLAVTGVSIAGWRLDRWLCRRAEARKRRRKIVRKLDLDDEPH